MPKTDGWYEGITLVMRETYSYEDALDMAEFGELMAGLVESDVEELGVRNMVVHYRHWCVQVTARIDNPLECTPIAGQLRKSTSLEIGCRVTSNLKEE